MALRTKPGLDSLMKRDLPWLEENRALISAIARSYGLDPAVVGGLCSRESGGGRLLGKRGAPPGAADSGHSRGLMGLDDRRHAGFIGLGNLWRKPAGNLAYGCWVLRSCLDALVRRTRDATEDGLIRAALACWDAGLADVLRVLRAGGDPDAVTHGGDYGRDVLERAAWLRLRGWQ